MSSENFVGIDLGGTAIKLALISQEGNILYKAETPTDVSEGGDQILYQMNQLMEQGMNKVGLSRKQLKGIGIGAPAFLDIERGFVHQAVNLGWKDYPLREKLEQITKLPVVVDNDANTAALGEMWKGAGEGTKDLLCITLGTGVGGGVILNGQIYHGARGTAGEVGHFTIMSEGGHPCNCGKTGCLETIASATGMVRLATTSLQEGQESVLQATYEENGKLEAKDITHAAESGDGLAQRIIQQVAHALGLFFGNYAVTFNPEKIVIGGGVSRAGERLFQPIRAEFKKYALPHLTGDIAIVPATLGNDAGVLGSAWLVHTKIHP